MAEVALGTIGAAASVVQLGDVALRLCRSISSFIGELKDAKDDMRHLRSTLDDTDSILRNLIAYIHEFQDSSSAKKEYEVLPDAVVAAVQHFYDSLKSLRECLPTDLSPSLPQKFRFVLGKKKIQIVTSQLVRCQASTSLALNIICNRNSIKLRDGLSSLRIDNETAATERKIIAQNCSQQVSQLLTEIRGISQQQPQALPSFEQVDKRTSNIVAKLESINRTIAAQGARSRRQKSTTAFAAVDEDTLAKLVRVCVMQTTTSKTDRDETSKVDDMCTNIASQAHREGFFDAKDAEESKVPTSEQSIWPGGKAQRSNLVQLFQKHETIWLRWAIIKLRVTGLRHRQTDIQRSDSYFSVEIDFIPRHIVSFGISLSYTDAPNWAKYYSICPSILIFNVIHDTTLMKEIFRNDDVDMLQRSMMNREIGLRDCDTDGLSILDHAMLMCSTRCIRYLLRYETRVPFSSDISLRVILHGPQSKATNLDGVHVPIPALYEFLMLCLNSGLLDGDGIQTLGDVWSLFWLDREKHPGQPTSITYEHKIMLNQALRTAGFNIQPFSWLSFSESGDNNAFGFNEFCLELCFKSGEDPNAPMQLWDGYRPLEVAVFLLSKEIYYWSSKLYSRLIHAVSPRLLVILMKAGADIFFAREVGGCLHSTAELAYELGVGYLWEAALIECGYDPNEVKMEDKRRKTVLEKFDSAERSGVDIEPMKEMLSAPGNIP
ncbi:uncharacterized protein GGS22DRAFT_189430 [Annulohypoxylon maeteangense]|uniref:uncharacterized protein n=1 Tax=Annulohypoxylon maeteangense TaxID=1927788 RepID=UPI002008B519|nr:uncharacterized protein GGS22DRAFT_189430 [Annulohypoxylon maeteangense]KAI0884303.1 hypothetical protein GGS22DRAFT_189430 [Annulohypoxylon maeteangense]